MKRLEQQKMQFHCILIIFFALSLGLGYAILTEKLTIDNTISYNSMKWDIGFSSVVDNGGTILSNSTISNDQKTININCDLGTNTGSETCIAKATITNNSTFKVMLTETPKITYDDTYINSLDIKWIKSSLSPKQLDGIYPGCSEDIQIKITTKELTEDILPEQDITIPITITMEWIEAEGSENIVNYSTGYEININNEIFYVVKTTNETVTLLAQENIDCNTNRQTPSQRQYTFSDEIGWEYAPGPKDIDIKTYTTTLYSYIDSYVSYIKELTDSSQITGDLISLNDLKNLGCTITNDYSSGSTCKNSKYYSWLITERNWWTKSANPSKASNVWLINTSGGTSLGAHGSSYSIRPVITIPTKVLASRQ